MFKWIVCPVVAAVVMGYGATAWAGGVIKFGDDKSVTVGFGLRASFRSVEAAAPDGVSRSADFGVDSVRLYTSASLNKYIKATFNTEKDGDSLRVLDAYGEIQFAPQFNLAFGRTIVPADRANLSGGYYLPAWDFADVASQFYSKFASRDDGAVIWGKVADNRLVYSFGAFQGRSGAPNQSDSLLYAGRLAVNLLDAEPAGGYFTGSSYYGDADILTIGLTVQHQSNGIGDAFVKDSYNAYGVDMLLDKKLPGDHGVFTLEGAWSRYDYGVTAARVDISGVVLPGSAGLAGAAYLFPQQVGWGKLQPFYRYQTYGSTEVVRHDVGLNYIIDGDNANLSFAYRALKAGDADREGAAVVGLQLQF